MRKRILAMALAVLLGAWVVSSCGSSKTTPPTVTGTVVSFVSDVPFCGVLNLRVRIIGLTLTPVGGGNPVTVLTTTSAGSPDLMVNFGELRDFVTILSLNSVPTGTYGQATITFSLATIVVNDPTKDPPISAINGTLAAASPTVNIQPPLTITQGAVSALRIDFDMRRSIAVDSQGQVTGAVTPLVTVSSLTASASQGFGEMDDLLGFVTSVNNTSSSVTGFIGGFSLSSLSGTAPIVTVNLTNPNQLCAPPIASNQACSPLALNALLTGSFVEMDAHVDSNANLIASSAANSVVVEDQEIPEINQLALIGNVVSVTRDPDGSVTQFVLYVSHEEPDDEAQVALDTTVAVNVSSSTLYQVSAQAANFAGLPFGASALAPGQQVVVHGIVTKPPTTELPTTVAADKVFLKLQAHQGNFTSLVAAQSDNKTGAFWLDTCCTLFQGAPILVLTNSGTAFVNLVGLSGLAPQPTVLVKGQLFYRAQSGVVNGIPVPTGTLVLLAKQVHQLE